MADTTDYLSVYRRFFEEFARTVNPDDQLPVKVGGYYLCDAELVGEIVDWTLQYLNQKHCPSSLLAPLTRIVIEEIKNACKKQPVACGYRTTDNTYQPLKLMQVVTGKVNEVCLRYHDNGKLLSLPPPSPGPPISSCAIKNSRRRMEDRHVIIEDFHAVFNIQDRSLASFYAVFDGHAGTDAAMYSVSHLHQFLAESPYYPTDPERALKDAFSRTDAQFLEKSNRENLRSGTTAVCALLRHKERMLYVAWLGDSQAVLVREGRAVQVVNPHKPDRQDERERIEHMGGCVLFWGTWRVNGQLAVSRAIGDLDYKPYVTSEPDLTAVPLDGTEDFLVLACDGLWDFVSEQEAVEAVYQQIHEAPGDLEAVSQKLVQLSKEQGSTDNISVIVVFLTDPLQLASRSVDVWERLSKKQPPTNTMDTSNNPFASESVPFQKPAGLLLDLGAGGDVFKQNGTSPSANDLYFLDRPSNGKGNFDDDDFGPETDVDAVDDVLLSPTKIANTQRNNNPFEDDDLEKRAFEADLEIQRQQTSDFDPVRETRQETPTPPADEVPGVTKVVTEPDNVAESGEDSEDEWNYYSVEPKAETADINQQSTQQVCEKSAQELEEEENMESQLNPNAAEFVPSPTQPMPTMEDILLAESPKKGITMENISVPSHKEFEHEVSQRPSELDLTDEPQTVPQPKIAAKLPDLINTEEGGDINPFLPPGAVCGKSIHHLENGGSFKDFLDQGDRNFQELQNSNLQASGGLGLDESEVSSTKAEFGDDSTMSFMASELQKTITDTGSSFAALEKSFTDNDLLETEFSSDMTGSDINELELKKSEICRESATEESLQEEEDSVIIKSTQEDSKIIESTQEEGIIIKNSQEALHMSFEIQKELVPEMESKPERVQLESEGTSSFEQDESSSPIQADSKVSDFDEKVMDLQTPDNEEKHITSEVENFLAAEISYNEQNEISLPDIDNVPLSPQTLQEDGQLSPATVSLELSAPHMEFVLSPEPSVPGDGELSPLPQLPPKSSQTPPESPVMPKPELSPIQNQDLEQNSEALPISPSLAPESPLKSPVLEQSQSPELSIAAQQLVETPQSPELKSPVWEASSPLPSGPDTALSTPETVPVGKDETPSPLLETNIPVDNFSLSETHFQTSQEKIVEKVEDLLEIAHGNEHPSQVQELDFDQTVVRHPTDTLPTDFSLEESRTGITDLLMEPIEDISAAQVPPPTPASVSQDVLTAELSTESESLIEKSDLSTEKVTIVEEKVDLQVEKTKEKKEDTDEIVTPAVAATALGGLVAAAAAVGVVKAAEEKPAEKKPTTEAKKAATPSKEKKGPVPDKSKTTKTTTTKPATSTAAKLNQKSTPTSPTKPLTTTARTSTPKKPSTTTSTTLTSKVTKSPATPTAKPKPTTTILSTKTTSTTKTSSTAKPGTPSPRSKPAGTTTTSKSAVLTNGEAAKPAAVKKTGTTTATKPPSRPATAPAATKTTTTKQLTSVTNRTTTTIPPRPKLGAINGTTTKPRTLGTVAPVTARSKVGMTRDTKLVTDKQVKETANKQISSSRSVTATKSATSATAKRVSGVTKTSVSVTNATKTASTKTATKKTMATATSKTTTKTAVTVTSTATENNELVKVQQVVD